MKKRVGVSVVKKKQEEVNKYENVGKKLKDTKLSFVRDVLTTFKTSLAEFATKHRERINSDPEFRQQFHKMCVSVGVDPLSSSKGFWADLLGVGDFYFEIGVKIIQISVKYRTMNGGIMSLYELRSHLQSSMKSTQQISIEDVNRAISKLEILGNGFRVVNLAGNTMVISVPLEINTDHELLMNAAQNQDGCVNARFIMDTYGWSAERFEIIIKPLLMEGIVWIDQHNGKPIVL